MRTGRRPTCAHLLVAAAAAAAALARAGTAGAASGFARDRTPLHLGNADGGSSAAATGTGGTALRLLLGLVVVLVLVWVVRALLKRAQRGPRMLAHGTGMSVVSTTPLAPGKAMHLVLVGDELVLVGSAEQGVTALRVYDERQSRVLLDTTQQPLAATGDDAGGAMQRLLDELRRRTAR